MVDVLISLLEGKSKNDQLHLLMFEAEMGELLYGLLVHPGKSVIYYEKIIKVCCVHWYIGNNCKVHCIERFKSYYFYVKYNKISCIKSYCKMANECIFFYFPNIFCEAF